ncbi:bacillithiol system redox-active protein YtxJ [Bacillus solimangrovi]|uniref:Thioredoxin n=1 Tax=Bacillus solimangrovi TaxID=1305675 RepID=A0A1E5LCH7_9BACI|nr:bacillithiol system redox-active protein YtxJ [Bacillus solimangrovi]OEH91792.1 thioredoxin [Bacillus solimangrovi]
MGMKQVQTIEEFEVIERENRRFIFLKNSLTCPISHQAYDEYQKYVAEYDESPTFYLHVQEARPLSNHIEEKFAIRHQSPQALLIEDGKVIWEASHWHITKKSLTEAFNK